MQRMSARFPLLVVHGSAAALLAACGGASRGPASAPTPGESRPPAPSTPSAATPAPVPNAPRGPSVAARYSSGTQRYAVVTNAEVVLAAEGAPPESDSLVTRAFVTYVLGGGGVGQSVGGAVDSVFVSSRRSPTASQAVTVALPFSGTLTASGVRFAGEPSGDSTATVTVPVVPTGPAAAACGRGSTDALLSVARELLVALPPSVAEGTAWRDSSTTTSCRGNVPFTTTTVHDYRVARLELDSAGARTATVERTTRSTITGQGSGGSVGATVVGTGTGQGRLTFDLAAGRYLGGEINSAADLTVNADGRPQRLTQRGTTRVTLVPVP
jgi:hypothetical protein